MTNCVLVRCEEKGIFSTFDFRCANCSRIVRNLTVWPAIFECNRDRPECKSFGVLIGHEPCRNCNKTVYLKIYSCELFGKCSISRNVHDVQSCQTCKRYEPVT